MYQKNKESDLGSEEVDLGKSIVIGCESSPSKSLVSK